MTQPESVSAEQRLQRDYYARTAGSYDTAHALEPEHELSLAWLIGVLQLQRMASVVEIGSGTGRLLGRIAAALPELQLYGVEPVVPLLQAAPKALRENANTLMLCGDGHRLPFADASIDVVCAFAVLHHVPQPERLLAEMFRVARRAVFISDSNNFGQGEPWMRAAKQCLNALGLWRAVDWVRTGFRGYHYSEGDGVYYSFSMFRHLPFIRRQSTRVHLMNTQGDPGNPYRQSGHVALLAFKH